MPTATVARLPLYLRILHSYADQGVTTVSSRDMAEGAGVKAANLRRDLWHLGSRGRRGVGYDVATLIESISAFLGVSRNWSVALVGVGSLGHAMARYDGYRQRGLHVVALFDTDTDLVGVCVAGLLVRHASRIAPTVRAMGVSIGVIATPAAVAQPSCDALVAGGVSSILNFAPTVLEVPDDVVVRRVDLGLELQLLAFGEHLKAPAGRTSLAAVDTRAAATRGVGVWYTIDSAAVGGGL